MTDSQFQALIRRFDALETRLAKVESWVEDIHEAVLPPKGAA